MTKLLYSRDPTRNDELKPPFIEKGGLEKSAGPRMSQKKSIPSEIFCSPCILEIM